MSTDADLARYETILTSLLRAAVARPTATDRATAYAHCVLGLEVPSISDGNEGVRSDRAIHELLTHYASHRIGQPIINAPLAPKALPPTLASNSATWIAVAWGALSNVAQPLRDVGDRPVHPADHRSEAMLGATTAVGTFEHLIAHQQPAGHFLAPSANDNLESWWYAELILLHAVGTYAVETNDPHAFQAAGRAADYHLNETQPDHATSEPWAVFPFLLLPETRSLADQVLHNANMMAPDGTTLLLLADALYCLRKFISRGTA